jgi:hypothetical protein
MMPATILRGPTKSRNTALRVWAPIKSPVRIEYAREIPRDLVRDLARHDDQPDMTGVLYGHRVARCIRVISTVQLEGLHPVGVFSARARGDVFLTEDDLARLEALHSVDAIALVIAGNMGGFFVREPGGAMQTIKSYQEFPVRKILRRKPPQIREWLALAAATVVAIALFAWPTNPIEIRTESNALRIRLHRAAVTDGARIQIVDGAERRSIPITRGLSSIVYAPLTHDVRITVTR